VSTQLRLVDAPKAPRRRATNKRSARVTTPASNRRSGRVVHWGDWHLDEQTRRVGRAGVAAAREALAEARAAEELSQAS
jgi:hypothetical protein